MKSLIIPASCVFCFRVTGVGKRNGCRVACALFSTNIWGDVNGGIIVTFSSQDRSFFGIRCVSLVVWAIRRWKRWYEVLGGPENLLVGPLRAAVHIFLCRKVWLCGVWLIRLNIAPSGSHFGRLNFNTQGDTNNTSYMIKQYMILIAVFRVL